jgi:hypothetical protein
MLQILRPGKIILPFLDRAVGGEEPGHVFGQEET